jgi:hypothetical protein
MNDKLSCKERGRMGAIALNSNPEKKSAAALKAAVTIRATRPNFYTEIGRMGRGMQKKKEVDQ